MPVNSFINQEKAKSIADVSCKFINTEEVPAIQISVITTGYKWYPFKKERFYIKPWAGTYGMNMPAFKKGIRQSYFLMNVEISLFTFEYASVMPV